MKIVCDACAAKYSIADDKVAGKVFKIRCKKCSNIIVVRGTASNEEAAAPAVEQPPNTDTKVFDYQGYDSPQAAMADEAEWHLVIDQEQVGPMTAAQVGEYFQRGEIDHESFIWKEGFADWEKLPDVAEFAGLGQSSDPSAASTNPTDMFGDAAAASDATTEENTALPAESFGHDLFGDGGAGASAGADLFGGDGDGGLHGADLFGGMGEDGSASPDADSGEMHMSAEAAAQLKGQRNENSVLFSLGNLAALASDTSKPTASSSSSSLGGAAAGGASSNTGGSEGSGLIDIRSMASVYLGNKGPSSSSGASLPAGSVDDLPVFSSGPFDSASPMLLPIQSSGPDNKVLYALVGVIGALVVAAAILVVIVMRDGGKETSGEEAVASADTPSEHESEKVADSGNATEVNPEEADDGSEVAATDDGSEVAATADVEEPGSSDSANTAPAPVRASVSHKSKTVTKGGRKKKNARTNANSNNRRPKTTTKKPPRAGTSSPSSSKCDAVACMVDPGKACCRKLSGGSSSRSNSRNASNSNLPDAPGSSDVKKGVSRVMGRVTSCGDKYGGRGKVTVKFKISGSGKVSSAHASGGGSALRSCVTSAVKRAKFPKTQKGLTVNYPFTFR